MKRLLTILLSLSFTVVLAVEIVESDRNPSTHNEVDDKYRGEAGFAFYKDANGSKKGAIRCDLCEIFKEILKEEREQTKIQRKILAILQERFDPQPKKIKVNGKECIANSSAECFQMPLTPEAKKIPVLRKWMENPSLQNAANYLRWQAKYFQELFKRGNSLPLAIAQFGKEAYPIEYRGDGYISLTGDMQRDVRQEAIEKLKDRLRLLLFFGIDSDMDLISFYQLKDMSLFQRLPVKVIFKDRKSMKTYDDFLNAIFSPQGKKMYRSFQTKLDPNMFTKFGIYTTPSVVVVDRVTKKAQIIYTGKLLPQMVKNSLYRYIENEGLVDHSLQMDYMGRDHNYSKDFYEKVFGISNINRYLEGLKR